MSCSCEEYEKKKPKAKCKMPKEYWTATKGIFFKGVDEPHTYRKFEGKRYRRDSYSRKKSDVTSRGKLLKKGGCSIRTVKVGKYWEL